MPSARMSSFVDEAPASVEDGFVASSRQDAIFAWFREGEGHLLVDAVAGSGKTTTILRGIAQAPEDNILLCAFNKRIQEELMERLDNPKAHAQTLHSVGFQALKQGLNFWPKLVKRPFDREDAIASAVSGNLPYGAKRLVGKISSLARELVVMRGDHDIPTHDVLRDLAEDFDFMPPSDMRLDPAQLFAVVQRALLVASDLEFVKTSGIDYKDMIFLPLWHEMLEPEFDMVVVDETQDLTLSQLAIARAVSKPWARFVIVGDRHQAIYAFRGAAHDSMDKLKAELGAAELPLDISYRCPVAVVEQARRFVPHIQPAPDAPDGIVDSVDSLRTLYDQVEAGDFVLSRTNAPLARIALALLRRQRRVRIQGRDIGAGLQRLVKQLAKKEAEHDVTAFCRRLHAWQEKEITRTIAAGREDRVEAITDRADTLLALCDGLTDTQALISRVDYLFTENAPEDSVICSTVHKAKGLEADRVWLLRSTFLRPSPCRCGHRHQGPGGPCKRCSCTTYEIDREHQQEERNIYYVAVTRAKSHLTWVEEQL